MSIIFRRAVECNDQSIFDRAILPSILELIAKILEVTGVANGAVSATRKSFEGILRRSRSATLKSDDAAKFAVGAARLIISRVRNSIQESKYSVRDGNELIKKLEDEIQSLAPSSNAEHGIVELISKRDMHRTAAEKSSEVVKIAVIASCRSRGSRYTHREVELERSELLVNLLGEGGRAKIETIRAEHNEITQELDAIQSGPEEMGQLLSNLESYKAERAAIADKMEELRRTLKMLEEQDAALATKMDRAQIELVELRQHQSARAKELTHKLSEKNTAIVFGDSVELVVESIQRFDETLEKHFANSVRSGSTKTKDMREVASSKANVFLVRVRNYFGAEADCVDFLRGRVDGLERDIKSMVCVLLCLQLFGVMDYRRANSTVLSLLFHSQQLEIESCNMLGLGETVKQLTKKLEAMKKYIDDDRDVITCLCGEAERMRDELIARLEQYVDATSTKLSPVQITVLSEIAPCLERLGVGCDRFTALLQATPGDASEAFPHVNSVASEETVVAANPVAPKAAWGNTESVDSKSIRDIQKEELEFQA